MVILATVIVLTALVLSLISPTAATAVPQVISIQGKVTNANGTNVSDGVYDFVFALYDGAGSSATNTFTESWSGASLFSSTMSSAPAAGGESLTYSSDTNEASLKAGQLLWNTTKGQAVTIVAVNTTTNVLTISPTAAAWATSDTITNRVFVKDGIFQVSLNSLNQNWGTTNFGQDNLFLGINFNADGEMKPRSQFQSAPYAIRAQSAGSVDGLAITAGKTLTVSNSITFGGTDGTAFTLPSASTTLVGTDSTQTLTNKTITTSGLLTASNGFTLSGGALSLPANAVTDAMVSDTLTASIFKGSGSTTNAVDLTTAEVAGTLSIANGGTNSTATPTAGGLAYGTGTAYAFTGAGTSGQCLTSAGTGTPTWGDCVKQIGSTWAMQNGVAANSWNSVTYGGNAFVAVASSGANRVMTSNDGINWTGRSATEDNNWTSVIYGNGMFVAVASSVLSSGTNLVMTSPNGINWTARSAAEANNWRSVTYGNGMFVAVSNSGTNRVMTSPDGINWTARSAAEANAWEAVTFGNGMFVAVSNSGTNRVMTSPDGINWTARSAATAAGWKSVVYGNGKYVAVGGTSAMYSTNGTTWTSATVPAYPWNEVTYGAGTFLAVTDWMPGSKFITSNDGINWSEQNSTAAYWRSAAYGNGVFVVVPYYGASNDKVQTSGTPTSNTSPTNNIFQGGLTVNAGLTANGGLTLGGFTANGGILYTDGSGVVAQTAVGSLGECLQSAGGGTPTWGTCGGGGVSADSLDFTELKDALALDATTSINLGAFNLTTSGTGGLVFGNTGDSSFAGELGIGTTSPSALLHIYGNSGILISDPDFTHPVTGEAPADAWLKISTVTGNQGGAEITGLSASNTITPLRLEGIYGTTGPFSSAGIDLVGKKSNGLASATAIDANRSVVRILNNSTDIFNILGDGSLTLAKYTTNGGILWANGSGLLAQTAAGSGGQCLQSAGGGAPTWGACGGTIADDSLDFDKLADSLTLDASTDIALGGFNLSTSGSGALQFNNTGGVAIAGNLSVAADKTIKLTGGTAFPGSPTEGEMFYRTDTDQLYLYTGSKWQADRSTATVIVAASDSKNKEKADFVADGTNDEAEIEAAIAALPSGGGLVSLLEGTYSIGSSLDVAKANVKLVGTGPGTKLVRAFDETAVRNTGLITIGDGTNSYTGISISNMQIDGAKATYTDANNYGILVKKGADQTVISDSLIQNNATGIYLNNALADLTKISILRNTISSNSAFGISTYYYVKYATVSQNNIQNNGGSGISWYYGSQYGTISDNTITGNSGDGVFFYQADYSVTVSGNTISSNTGYGINASQDYSKVVISNNQVISNTAGGIKVDGGGNIVTGNSIVSNSNAGVYLELNASANTITGNYISSNTREGVYLSGGAINNVVSDNRIDGNGGSGSYNHIHVGDIFGGANNNSITGNYITDTAGSGFAIYIRSNSSGTYLADNTFSGTGAASISDNSTTTIHANQQNASGDLILKTSGNVGLGLTNPSALLHLAAGTTTKAPLKFTAGTNLTTAEAGAMEFDGTRLYITNGSNQRKTIAFSDDVVSIADDSINFDKLADSMTLDASTDIALGGFNLSTSGSGALQFNNTGGVAIAGNLSVAADKTIKLAGGTSFPGSPTEGEMFYRTDTDQLYLYTGSKWQADRSTATVIVAASDSKNKEKADFVADGTNDEAEIEAAIAALPSGGGLVSLLEGTFNIGADITITKNNVSLVGQGVATVLKRMWNETGGSAVSGVITLGDNGTNTYSGIMLSNFKIDGNKASYTNTNNHGFLARQKITSSSFQNLVVTNNAGNGVSSAGTNNNNNLSFVGGEYSSNTGIGIYLNYLESALVQGTKITGNGSYGVQLYSGSNNTITANTIKNNGGRGIYGYQSDNATISDNIIQSSGDNGINISSTSDNVSITGNSILDSAANGLSFAGILGTIAGNTSSGNSGDGFYISSDNNAITGNTAQSNSGSGINMPYAGNNVVSGNQLKNNGGTGSTSSLVLGPSSSGNLITNNLIVDSSGTGSAIAIAMSASNNILSGNVYSGTGASSISDSSTSTIYRLQQYGTTGDLILKTSGNVGLGLTNPSALLHLAAGTTTKAPLKFTAGTNLTTAEAGAMEFDGTRLYITNGSNQRKTIAFSDDGGGGSSSISGLTAAIATNSIDNLNYAQTWNWSTLTTETGLALNGGTAMTTGSLLNLSGTFNQSSGNVGQLGNFSITNTSSNGLGTAVYSYGLKFQSTFNSSSAGEKNITAISIDPPAFTSCTVGECFWKGLNITLRDSGAASNIEQVGLQVTPGNGIAAGTMIGVRISTINGGGGGAGAEQALVIGPGWDSALTVNGTSILNGSGVVQSAGLSGTYGNALTFSNTVTFGSSGNTVTLSSGGLLYAGSARPIKVITLSPEYTNATFSTDGSATTDGNMISDNTGSAGGWKNYYEWTSTNASLQDYTIMVRVTLPQDFDAWDTNAFALSYQTGTANAADNAISFSINNETDTPGTVVCEQATGQASTSWTTTNMTCSAATLDDASAPEWDAAGETAVIRVKVKAKNTASALARVGDIVLRYRAKF